MVDVTRAFCALLPWLFTSVRIETVASPPVTLADHKRSPLLHMHRMRLHQPHVSINSRTLVKPTVAQRGIDAHQQDVFLTRIHEVSHVELERDRIRRCAARCKSR